MVRALRRIGWLLALLFVLYLVAANVFLNAGFAPGLINRKPDRFSMQWERGLSLYPGHVVLWRAKFRGHARRVVWYANADRLSGRIALWPLLRRELQVPHTWADNVTGGFDLAHELAPAEPRPGGWVLRFDRIATGSLREVRWGSHALSADGHAEFGLWKQLRGGALEIFPSQATLRAVRLRQGDIDWLRDATLAIRFALPRHGRDEAAGWHRLALATLTLELDGRLPAFAVHMDEEPRWRGAVQRGEGGTVQAKLALERGELKHGSALTLGVPLQATDSTGKHWTQQANLRARVAETIELTLDLPPPPSGKGRISAELHVAGRQVFPHEKAPPLLSRVSGTVGVQWRFDSLAWLGPLLSKATWLQLDGAGEVGANIRLKDGRIDAGSTLTIPDVAWHADVQGERFTGRARADGRVDTEDGELRPRIDIAVQQFQIGELASSPQQAMVRGENLRLELRSAGRVIEFRDSLRARLVFERADVPDLRGFNRYLPGAALRFLGGRGRLSGDLQLDPAGKVGKGRLQVQARQAQLALNDLEFSGDVDVAAQLARADLSNDEFVLDGTRLGVRNVRISDPERASPGDWWADIRFDRGRLHWGSPLRIDTTASARLHDVSLLLALFTRNKDYPRWVLRVLDAGVVEAATRAVMRDGAIVLEDLSVSNDRFDLKARLRLAGKHARGDLFLRWLRFGLGLELKDGERKFHLIKAAEWFGRQPRLLPAAG